MVRIRTLTLSIAAVCALGACSQSNTPDTAPKPAATAPTAPASSASTANADASRQNPFFKPSTLPFHAPPFDRIKDADFKPAIKEGMKRQLAQVRKIANNPQPPTFKNTIVAMEKSGQMLDRVEMVFSSLTSANTNDTLQKVQEEEAPKLAAHQDAIYLNDKLFKRVQTVYNKRDQLKLDPEAQRLLEVYYKRFVHDGARLGEADKAKLRKLNTQLSTLTTAFSNKLLAATKAAALVVDDKSKLAGLSDAQIAAAAQAAKDRGLEGKWVLTLQNTTQQPALSELTDRATRRALFEASWNRAEQGGKNDTRATISKIAKLRAEKAKLLGYDNFAAYKLYNQMAKTPARVDDFLSRLVQPARHQEQAEQKQLQQLVDASGKHFKLQPWDWKFYAEKLRKKKYNLDESQIKPYFKLETVLHKGLFFAANKLYGLTFKQRKDIPVYQKDVSVYEVFDKDGSSLGLIYFDYFKRDNKSGGAWMSNFVTQSKLSGDKPVVYNVANFAKPAAGKPALLTFDDVTTMFHEFGHALNGLFASQQYPTLSGTATARDFVEYPSQFNEHWATNKKVLANYAINYKTGKPMPQKLVDKIKKAATFDEGYDFTELLAAAELDMQWHELPASAPRKKVDAFEKKALKATHMDIHDVPPRYRSSYFLHIWSNGYSAGYYAYLWSEMLDDDSYQWFMDHGGLTRKNGQRFRDMILSRGNSENLEKMFEAFYGSKPKIGPMLKFRGLRGTQH